MKYLKDKIKELAIKKGEFILASGKKSNYYFDIKRVLLNGDFLYEVTKKISKELYHINVKEKVDGIAGVGLGGTLLVSSVLNNYNYHGNLEGTIIRKDAKNHGTDVIVENPHPDKNFVLLEDVITTGTSIYSAGTQLTVMNAVNIVGIIIILNRQQGGIELLKNNFSCPIKCFFKASDFI